MVDPKRFRVRITGLVQGVGFRPFLRRLADERHVGGWARNTGGVVIAEIEGEPDNCGAFLRDVRDMAPAPARLESVEIEEVETTAKLDLDFVIPQSQLDGDAERFIPVDIGICEECRRELLDPGDRRSDYPFTNCAHCGPRYTILRDLPYDRERTSMRDFRLCVDCHGEYTHTEDRRYHAEPNACGACGPQYTFVDSGGQLSGKDALENAGALLRNGGVLALKGIGGFHLVCRADSYRAVERLRTGKARPDKPMAVMVADLREAARFTRVSEAAEALLTGPDRPIVLVPQDRFNGMTFTGPGAAANAGGPSARLAPNINKGLSTLGIMLPYAPVHVLLMARTKSPLVYTSANRNGETLIADNGEAQAELRGVADAWLMHDRKILNRCDDSVVRPVGKRTITLRAGRGRAPHFVRLPGSYAPILAGGADLKNAVCLASGGWAHLGPFVGDLADAGNLDHYRKTIESLCRLLRIKPEVVACDAHPDYVSTDYARSLGLPVVPVQHHHAHIASVMAERGLEDPVIGVAFDGLGWGGDGTSWGGEWLICDLTQFTRVAHLNEVPLPGGDSSAREPWRTAVGHLHGLGLSAEDISRRLPQISPAHIGKVVSMLTHHVNTFPTSSCGRLFEAVAAVCLGTVGQSYEGQAAAYLESEAARKLSSRPYEFTFAFRDETPFVIESEGMWRRLLDELDAGVPVGAISARFHDGLAIAIQQVCIELRDREKLQDVVLSGGVFVNSHLLETAIGLLESVGFRVHTPERVPINDGGIGLGQAAIAAAIQRARKVRL